MGFSNKQSMWLSLDFLNSLLKNKESSAAEANEFRAWNRQWMCCLPNSTSYPS